MAKILLVEDDNNLREIYEARLQAEGYTIVSAKDGEEALVVAKKEQPDLVIADVMMPRISGFEMLDILRNTEGLRDVKVIMLTALGQAEDKTRADQLGADRYLVKSQVTLEDIVKTAADLLAGMPAGVAAAMPVAATPSPAPTPAPAIPVVSPPADDTTVQSPAPTTPQPTIPVVNAPVVAQPPTPPPVTPAPPAPAQTNTDQLVADAVKDLMTGTQAENTPAPAPTAPAPTPPPAAAPVNQVTPAPQVPPTQPQASDDDDNVTIARKKIIQPLTPATGAAPAPVGLDELLAKEGINNPTNTAPHNPSPGATTVPGMVQPPHPPGHVITPNNNNGPVDPNTIAL